MTEKIWIAIITVIVGPLIGVGGKVLWDWWKNRKALSEEERNKKMGLYITQLSKLHGLQEDCRDKLKCSRAIILKAENGGGIPKEGHQIYSSILWETTDSETSPLRDSWQRQPVDKEYSDLLQKVYVEKYVLLETEKQKNSMQKNLYKSNRIEKSEVIKLYIDNNKLIYLSLNYLLEKDHDIKSHEHKDNLRILTSEFRKLFQEMHSLSE